MLHIPAKKTLLLICCYKRTSDYYLLTTSRTHMEPIAKTIWAPYGPHIVTHMGPICFAGWDTAAQLMWHYCWCNWITTNCSSSTLPRHG